MNVSGQPHTPPALTLGKMLRTNWTGWMDQKFGLEALKKLNISWPCQETNLNYSFIHPDHRLPTTPTALSQLPFYSQSYPEYMCYSCNRLSVQQPLLIQQEMNQEVVWKWITVKWRQWLSWFQLVLYSSVCYLTRSSVPVTWQAAIIFRHYFTLVVLHVQLMLSVISGYRHKVDETCTLLGYYTVTSDNLWPM